MMRSILRPLAGMLLPWLCVSVFAALPVPADARASDSIFVKDNLVAWCIVPFDARHRGPVERAEMLKQLGITKLAYDWRDEHIPTFEAEILALQKQNVEFFAHWCPLGDTAHPAFRTMMDLIAKYHLHPQLWVMAPAAEAASQEQRVEVNARAMLPYVEEAKRLGCPLALYNHGGWAGEPENMIAMVEWLRRNAGTDAIGIVYNFHHGHEHLSSFPAAFQKMLPYLLCVNLNGMTVGDAEVLGSGQAKGALGQSLRVDQKILPLGRGREDRAVLEMVRDSGYRGPLGILCHREEADAAQALQENLDGLKQLLPLIGDTEAAATYEP